MTPILTGQRNLGAGPKNDTPDIWKYLRANPVRSSNGPQSTKNVLTNIGPSGQKKTIVHISYLKEARKFGSKLLVGINDDKSVKQLKGPSRPINNERDRALFLAAFPFVDAVCIFPGKRATKFLDLAKPKVYVKGGDYDISSMYIGERKVLEKYKTEIKFAKFVENKSTSSIIKKL